MNANEALARLRRLGVSAFSTGDAAAVLGQSKFAASKTVSRLAAAGHVVRIRHGLWTADPEIGPYRLVPWLTAPLPSYVSLLTALNLHGMIEQLPSTIYAVTLSSTERMTTALGAFSFHHVAPDVFGGYTESPDGVLLASPEKALFDLAYLSAGRSRLFRTVPELELPARFRRRELLRWQSKLEAPRTRSLVDAALERLLARAR